MQQPIIILLITALLTGCGSRTNPTSSDTKIRWNKQDVAAVAFVGYFTYASDFLASSTYKMYTFPARRARSEDCGGFPWAREIPPPQ